MGVVRTTSVTSGIGAGLEHADGSRYAHVVFLGERAETRVMPAKHAGQGDVSPAQPREHALDGETARFFAELCSQAGVDAAKYRESIFTRRRAACLRTLRTREVRDAVKAVRTSRVSRDRAMSAVMIGVTSFYRDPAVFESLGELVAPIAAERGTVQALSVGCSDGAEVYSLAMLLAERGLLDRATLWGADCRQEAIDSARHGVFTASSVQSIPAPVRGRYVRTHLQGGWGGKRAPTYRVVEEIRGACRWVVSDAFDLPGAPALPRVFDLMVCRNLAIYLNPEAAEELWRGLGARLRTGGLLIVGKAERPVAREGLAWTRLAPCVYRKEDER